MSVYLVSKLKIVKIIKIYLLIYGNPDMIDNNNNN